MKKVDEVPVDRAELFASLLKERSLKCSFPELGRVAEGPIVQHSARPDGTVLLNLFNAGDSAIRLEPAQLAQLDEPIELAPHKSRLVSLVR